MLNTSRKAAVTLGLGALVLAGSPAIAASASTPGAERTVSAAQAAACFAGQSTHSGRTGTTYFTSNCADVRFRARVICSNAFDSNTNYGNIVQPTGKSSYECSVLLKATDVNGQYYNGTAWANLPF